MAVPKTMTFDEFAAVYCERQDSEPAFLRDTLLKQKEEFAPDGWMLLQCQMLDSSSLGTLVILPYGPNNTYKSPPDHPISPRGLASDMSTITALLPAAAVTPLQMGFKELQALIQKRQDYANELVRNVNMKRPRKKEQVAIDRARRIRASCEIAADILGEKISDREKEVRIKAVLLSALLD